VDVDAVEEGPLMRFWLRALEEAKQVHSLMGPA
jgi:hypothetical protein